MPNRSMWIMKLISYNKFGNWWYNDDVCRELTCDTLINDCDNKYNAGTSPSANGIAKPLRIYRCPDHYYSNSKRLTDMRETHPITGQRKQNYKQSKAFQLGGKRGEPGWQNKLDEAQHLWDIEIKNHLLDTAPIDKVLKVMSEPKPLRTVTTTVKPRNYSLVTSLKELYNYTCQVLGCNEQEVDLAHLYPHRYDDSVDNETNAAVLCKNHHWSLDHKRMYIEDDLTFTRYNLDGKLIEESIIVCHKDHKIDAKFIAKSQNWFLGWEQSNDRKEQAMG